MAKTASQEIADTVAQIIDGRIAALNDEKLRLQPAAVAARLAEIDAQLFEWNAEKARIDPKRSPINIAKEQGFTS